MQRIVRLLALVLVVELCSHGETKTIVYNSYSSGPAVDASYPPQNNTGGGVTRTEASESSGRGFPSGSGGGGGGFPFSIHPDYLSKPVPVASRPDVGYKTPKYIVYPSYSQNSRNSVPYYNAPVAMDRFAPGEAYGGTLYKLKKQKQSFASAGGGAPFASIPAASFNSPVSVASPNLLRPAASDNSPVTILAPPGGSSSGQSALPPPPPSPPAPPPSGTPTFFMPTPVPNSGEDTPPPPPPPPPSHSTDHSPETNSLMDSSEVALFPPNSHSGYLPPPNKVPTERRPITGYLPPTEASSESSTGTAVYKPSSDLFKFPPNINSSYLPPDANGRSKNPVTSYIPPPSGDTETRSNSQGAAAPEPPGYNGTAELFKFPPNTISQYLPPGEIDGSKLSATSYLPPPSGDPRSPTYLKPASDAGGGQALNRFPPNVNSDYLPPSVNKPSDPSAASYLPPPSGDPRSPSNLKPPSDAGQGQALNRFPPNVNSDYLPPTANKPSDPSATSYLPPPSGDPQSPANLKPLRPESPSAPSPPLGPVVSDELYRFPPNVQNGYLSAKVPSQNPVTSYLPPPSGSPNAPSYLSPSAPEPQPAPNAYIPPADLYRFPPNVHSPYLPPYHSAPRPNNAVTSYLPPASGIPGDDAIGTIPVGPGKPQYLPPRYPDSGPPPPPMQQPMQPAPMKMPPMMQPTMMGGPPDAPMDGPPTGPSGMGDDHDHHHHHHDHDFPYFTGFDHDHYPDFIYDHDHDHFHHHHDEPTTVPPPPPPPPAPETPRLKNYSYYYLSRTLWYVPLYFTLYFTFYVAILIIRSIARHKVNLPNQWVGNARSFASVRDLSDVETQRKATMMAVFAMQQIEDFREKYL